MTRPKFRDGVSLAVLFAAILGLDQYVKYLCVTLLQPVGSFSLWPEVFGLTYRENTGAAFSIFRGKTVLLSVFTLVVLAALLILIVRGRVVHPVARCAAVFVLAGGCGNLLDRVLRGYVVDMFDFSLINFPVFNVADIFVTCGCVLFFLVFLFTKGESIR